MNPQSFFYPQIVVYLGSSTKTHLAISPLSVDYQQLAVCSRKTSYFPIQLHKSLSLTSQRPRLQPLHIGTGG